MAVRHFDLATGLTAFLCRGFGAIAAATISRLLRLFHGRRGRRLARGRIPLGRVIADFCVAASEYRTE